MNKKLWFLVPVMFLFWFVNYVVFAYGFARLGLSAFALAMIVLPYAVDFVLATYMSSTQKVNAETGFWGSTAVFYLWLLNTFACAVTVAIFYFAFVSHLWGAALFVGFIYFAVRTIIFVIAPVFLI